MTLQRCMLFTYRGLLLFYPAAFRRRFAPEMLQIAEDSAPREWPFIFGDTGASIVRSWWEGSASSGPASDPNAYLALGSSGLSASALIRGLALSMAILIGFCYASSLGVADLPKCDSAAASNNAR